MSFQFSACSRLLKSKILRSILLPIYSEVLFIRPYGYGGAKRDRTADLLRARQALSQLSYSPIQSLTDTFDLPLVKELIHSQTRRSHAKFACANESWRQRSMRKNLVGLSGLEPPTSPLSGVRSNHLSYKPIKVFLLVTFSSDNLCGHCTMRIFR